MNNFHFCDFFADANKCRIFCKFQDHNCVRELRALVQQQQSKISDMHTELAEHKLQLQEQKREMQLLKVITDLYCKMPEILLAFSVFQALVLCNYKE